MKRIVKLGAVLLLAIPTLTSSTRADEELIRRLKNEMAARIDPDNQLAKAEIVFTATLAGAIEVGIAKKYPPIRMYTLQFTGMKVTRGKVPVKTKAHYSIQALHAPEFPVGETCTFAARLVGDELLIDYLSPGPRIQTVDRETRMKELEQLIRDQAKPKPR